MVTNTTVNYKGGTLNIAKDVSTTGPFYATKSINVLQDQIYKVTFDVTALAMGTSSLTLAFQNSDNPTVLLDYNTPLNNSTTGTYTYYIVPKTNQVNLLFNVAYSASGTFNYSIDNFKVENMSNEFNPIYSAVLNNLTDYYSFGSPMPGRNFNSNSYRRGFNGMEKDDEINGNGNSYDFGARQNDPRLGRFWSRDPLTNRSPDKSPYNFVSNNPINRIDPDGQWDIEVHVYKDRKMYGYGIAIVKDRNGNEVDRFLVRVEGTGGSNRNKVNSDTPLGTYDVPDKNSYTSGGSRASYGPNPRLLLTPEDGEIEESGRDQIRIHGGRQEKKNAKGEWEKVKSPLLKKTHGCMRAMDDEMKKLKETTDELEKNDSKESGGKLIIKDDLIKVKSDGLLPVEGKTNYYVPGEQPAEKKEEAPKSDSPYHL